MEPHLKVSDQIALFLRDKGIRHVFGIIGSANAHIFDSIDKLGFTEIICVHHEQAATMAMQTYYRTSGTITAAIVTAGGGSTNAITGVVSAWADSIPGIVISGQENSRYIQSMDNFRMWGIQGYDSTRMVEQVTKYAARVMDPRAARMELEKAYEISGSGRPGPVWLDFPMDVQGARVPDEAWLPWQSSSKQEAIAPPQLAVVAGLLREAQRPLFWFGNGVRLSGAEGILKSVIDSFQVPFLLAWAGSDLVDNGHPLHMGRAGVYGQRAANFALQNADLVIAVGTRLSISMIGYDQTELVREGKLVQVDVDPQELTKISKVDMIRVESDAGRFLQALLEETSEASDLARSPRTEWLAYCQSMKVKYPWVGREHADTPGYLNSYRFLALFQGFFKSDQHITTDMGTALLGAHQVLSLGPGQRLMTSTGLGEMGYGLPAAIGISFARDRGEVLCLNCDGGMMMNLQELQTIVHHKLPIKIIVFNNDGYLMIKHTQKNLFRGKYTGTNLATGVSCPDFAKVASAFDIPYYSIRTEADCGLVLPQVQDSSGPVLCEVFMDPEQYFFPKLGLAANPDGSIVSPPLEDLSPFLPRNELAEAMLVGVHPKSMSIKP